MSSRLKAIVSRFVAITLHLKGIAIDSLTHEEMRISS